MGTTKGVNLTERAEGATARTPSPQNKSGMLVNAIRVAAAVPAGNMLA
jgi:hypothetical protein